MPGVIANPALLAGLLPEHDATARATHQREWAGVASVALHGVLLLLMAQVVPHVIAPAPLRPPAAVAPVTMTISLKDLPIVFTPAVRPGGGGGGGGAREHGPVPRAHGRGHDRVTLPVARPVAPLAPLVGKELPLQMLDIPVVPQALGDGVVVGLPTGAEGAAPSRGPGSGGGVGDGTGTGAGSGAGSGLGSGSGGGMGGGMGGRVYVPGGGVSAPLLLAQVRPSYTPEALRTRVQGSVTLEAIVRRNGFADTIRVLRSLDPGLDGEAVAALRQWRFRPGRVGDTPVDVLVTVVIDFRIR